MELYTYFRYKLKQLIMKKILYLLVTFLTGTAVLKAQYIAPADYETMSGRNRK